MLTYGQQPNPGMWMTMQTSPQTGGGLIDGYVLVVSSHAGTRDGLTALLWEYGIPAYAAPGIDAPEKIAAARGAPALLLLHLDRMGAISIVELENFRMRHDVPLLCIAPADAHQPHVQALLQMAGDFIMTPYEPTELMLRIRRVCTPARRPGAAREAVQPTPAQAPPTFSDTERIILQRLSETIGEPVELDELAALLPSDTPEARRRLLRVHIFRLRRKIEPVPRNPTYLRTVRDYGYYLAQELEWLK